VTVNVGVYMELVRVTRGRTGNLTLLTMIWRIFKFITDIVSKVNDLLRKRTCFYITNNFFYIRLS